MGIRPAVNGGEIYAGDEHVKLSNVDRRHSWGQLKKRLDTFEPAVGVTIAPYTPRIIDAGKAEAWLGRSRQMRDVSAQIDTRIAALLAARTEVLGETNAQLSAYRADLAGFDGDARLQRDLSAAWPRLRASAMASITSAFNARIDAVRALRHAAAECDEMDTIDLEAIGAPDVGITSLWSADSAPPPVMTLAGFDGERRGDVVRYWSREDLARHGPPALVDTGAIIWVNDTSDRTVEAALTLARERFGSAAVFGDAAYIEQCRRAARRLGMEIETITVAEARRRARRTRLRTDEVRRRALEAHVGHRPDPAMRGRWARAYRRATPADDPTGWQDQPVMLADLAHHTAVPTRASEPPVRVRARDLAVADVAAKERLGRARAGNAGGID